MRFILNMGVRCWVLERLCAVGADCNLPSALPGRSVRTHRPPQNDLPAPDSSSRERERDRGCGVPPALGTLPFAVGSRLPFPCVSQWAVHACRCGRGRSVPGNRVRGESLREQPAAPLHARSCRLRRIIRSGEIPESATGGHATWRSGHRAAGAHPPKERGASAPRPREWFPARGPGGGTRFSATRPGRGWRRGRSAMRRFRRSPGSEPASWPCRPSRGVVPPRYVSTFPAPHWRGGFAAANPYLRPSTLYPLPSSRTVRS
jgi:hypothetical protein